MIIRFIIKTMNNRFISTSSSKTFLLSTLTLATISLCLFKLASFDLWLHLKTGQLILEKGGFVRVDPFSFPILGTEWIAHEWFFGVIFFLLFQLVKSGGLVILKVLLILLIQYLLLSSNDESRRKYWLSVPLFFIALLLSRFRLMLRPHLFSLLFLALYYFGYQRWREGQKTWAIVFPLVMIFWVNLHAGSVFGLAFLLFMLIGELALPFLSFFKETPLPRNQLTSLAIIFLLTISAALINPYGYHTLLLPFTLKNMQQIPHLKLIEWQPFTFLEKPFLFSFMTIVSIWLLLRIKRLNPAQVILYCFYTFLVLSARRGVPYWAFLIIPLVETSFSGIFEQPEVKRLRLALIATRLLGLTMVITGLLLAIRPAPIYQFGLGSRYDKLPKQAADFILAENINGRLFNSYRLGGYLIWRLAPERKVFIDGRASMYRKLFRTRSLFKVEQLLNFYNVDYLIVNYQSNLPFSLDREPDEKKWALVFWDDAARVYLKRTPKFADIIKRHQYNLVKPTDNTLGFLQTDKRNYPLIEQEITRALQQSPYNFLGKIFLVGLRYAQNQPRKAEELLSQILKRKPYNQTATYFALANLLHGLKQDEKALRYVEQGLKKQPQDWAGYWLLGNIYVTLNDKEKAVNAYREGLKHKNDSYILNFTLGYVYYQAKEYQLALDFFDKAYRLDPGNNRTWPILAKIYSYQGKQEKARELNERYQKSLPPEKRSTAR